MFVSAVMGVAPGWEQFAPMVLKGDPGLKKERLHAHIRVTKENYVRCTNPMMLIGSSYR
jgi:hypothetical protein